MTNARRRNDGLEEHDPNSTAPSVAQAAAYAQPAPRRTGPLQGLTDPSLKAVGTQHRGFRTLIHNHYFMRLWLAQLISQTIMNAANYALIIVTQQTGSGSFTAAAGAIVAFSLPALLFGAPAGVLVDRFDRRLVLWVSNLLRAVASIGFVFVLMIDSTPLLPVYILAFFMALVGQFFAPAEGAAIPLLVRREEMIHALSLFNITFTLAQAAGLIILGPLMLALVPQISLDLGTHGIEFTSRETLFIVIALLYLVCVGLILSLPKARMKVSQQSHNQQDVLFAPKDMSQIRRVYISILQTGNFIRKDRRLLISVGQLALGGSVVAVIAMIAPGFVHEFFNKPAELAAIVFVPAGAGLVLGSAITPNVAKRFGYTRTITTGVFMVAGSAALLAAVHAIAPHLYGSEYVLRCPIVFGCHDAADLHHRHWAGLYQRSGADHAAGPLTELDQRARAGGAGHDSQRGYDSIRTRYGSSRRRVWAIARDTGSGWYNSDWRTFECLYWWSARRWRTPACIIMCIWQVA